MDLSGFIVVALGISFFFGGAAWLEIRSRKNNRPPGKTHSRNNLRFNHVRRADGEQACGEQ